MIEKFPNQKKEEMQKFINYSNLIIQSLLTAYDFENKDKKKLFYTLPK